MAKRFNTNNMVEIRITSNFIMSKLQYHQNYNYN